MSIGDVKMEDPRVQMALTGMTKFAPRHLRTAGTLLLMVVCAGPALAQIKVGKNVRVSHARGDVEHDEVLLAGDPTDPKRLLGCSTIRDQKRNVWTTVAYGSWDGGESWSPAVESKDFLDAQDPACALGPDGAAYFAALTEDAEHKRHMHVYRSGDGGKTWAPPVPLSGVDREYITVDATGGKYHGRVYINGTKSMRAIQGDTFATGVGLFLSQDRGEHFTGPVLRAGLGDTYVLGMGNSAILSDGTILSTFGLMKSYESGRGIEENTPQRANAWLKVAVSNDGGESYSSVASVGDWWMPWPPNKTSVVPTIAVDPGSEAFKDRVYIVWPDAKDGRTDVLLAYSTDKGKTWSKPRRVNDDRAAADPAAGPHTLLPVVAVNRQGVVGVSWYDRRDSADNLGWWVRFTASQDGGDTFLPSVRVSEAANQYAGREQWSVGAGVIGGGSTEESRRSKTLTLSAYVNPFIYNGGHTTGFAADAAGGFHPFWIDNRTGVSQIWTASVAVTGAARKNGAADLASLDDVTDKLEVTLEDVRFDRATNLLTVSARLKNTSKERILAPLMLRALTMQSPLGVPEAVDADNGKSSAGAVWDLSKNAGGAALAPGAESTPRILKFRVADLRPIHRGDTFKLGIIVLEARILGKTEKPAPASTDAAK
jgi:hypothetical protein